jgi:hypothetical protein
LFCRDPAQAGRFLSFEQGDLAGQWLDQQQPI